MTYLTEEDGFTAGRINSFKEDSLGNIWIGSFDGLTKYDGSIFTHFRLSDDDYENEISSVFIDSKGTIWLGTTRRFNDIR